ncbi:MAG: hypothetical protein HW416_1463 [Chloroflexi bacterium]|nr:hypothetical protein [Chloroflexota bacterium]
MNVDTEARLIAEQEASTTVAPRKTWDAGEYDAKHRYVPRYGVDLLSVLRTKGQMSITAGPLLPRHHERIKDTYALAAWKHRERIDLDRLDGATSVDSQAA